MGGRMTIRDDDTLVKTKQSAQDQTEIAFEAWWQASGQFHRSGGGDYEKTFAWHAWLASLACTEQPAQQEIEELTAQRDKLADILTRTANALKGEPAELSAHSWHDLPEVAQQLKTAQQEPVACANGCRGFVKNPPAREWVGLTDDEIALIVAECSASAHKWDDFSFARAIEAAHGIGEKK